MVSCFVLCVNGENKTSKLLHFWPKRVEFFHFYVDRFCVWVQNAARKVATVARFRVDGAYFLGFSTFLSEKCNCHTVSLWSRAYSFGFGTLEAGILATVVLLPIGLSENCFSVRSVQERFVLLASQLLPSTLIGSNNVQVARLVMACHKCICACLGMFLCISSQYSSIPSSGVGKW